MLSKKNKMMFLLFLLLLVGIIGAAAWWILQPLPANFNPDPAAGKGAPVPGAMTPKGKKKQPAASPAAQTLHSPARTTPAGTQAAGLKKRPEQSAEMPRSVPLSGSLAKLTGLRAQLQELDAQVAVAERNAKLNKLETPEPVVTALSGPPVLQLPLLSSPDARKEKSTAPERLPEIRVVSVQGVNGDLTATIRTTSGRLATVRQGGRFAGGIAEISRSGVLIRSGRSVKPLLFE